MRGAMFDCQPCESCSQCANVMLPCFDVHEFCCVLFLLQFACVYVGLC